MFKITALSKYKDLNGSPRLYYVLGLSSILSVLSFIFYKNFFITVVLLASGVVSYIVLSRKPKPVLIEMDDKALAYDGSKMPWANCVGWAMVDLGDVTEIIVQTTDMTQQFLYFYFKENQPGVKQFIMYITDHTPYLPAIQQKNVVHRFLRTLDLI
jgi:type II secretory pathway component PulF